MDLLTTYLVVYGILALSHILIQMLLAHREYKKQQHSKFVDFHKDYNTSVSVVIPCYNEKPENLDSCIASLLKQQYESSISVIVVDDGSKNRTKLLPIYQKYQADRRFTVVLAEQNKGKREALKTGFDMASGEIIVAIDSDTILEIPNGIKDIVKQFKNPEVGAVTGDVRVKNKHKNFLTKLISYRYWTAFHQERAAQSLFDVLMCCSGPFSAYRKSVVDKLKDRFINQRFLGKKCTFGDDRHLTNLILEDGYKVRFDNHAVAYTYVPENLHDYLKQQVRWNRSFYREMLWTIKHVHKHHFYMLYDLVLQFLLPFMLVIALIAMVYQAIYLDINKLWGYVLILVGIALLRSTYGMIRTKDVGFFRFVFYGFMHVFLLIPARFYALATLGKTGWGTR